MDTLTDFHVGIQYVVRRLTNPDLTFEKLGAERGISKQAVEKSCKKALEYLKAYPPGKPKPEPLPPSPPPRPPPMPCSECITKDTLIAMLRRQLILVGVAIQGLKFFKEQVLKFFPKFKAKRLPAFEKKTNPRLAC